MTKLALALPVVAWLSVLSGCGDDAGSTGGGGSGGAGPGSGGEGPGSGGGGGGAPSTEGAYVVDTLGAPAAGLDVLVHDASGGVVARGKTDSDGRFRSAIPDGGGVTVLYRDLDKYASQAPRAAASVLGVAAGSEARAVVPPQAANKNAGTMSVTLNVDPSIDIWNLVPSCDTSTMAYEVMVGIGGCAESATFDAVVFVDGVMGSRRVVYPDLAWEPGGNVSLDVDPVLVETTPITTVALTGFGADITYFGAAFAAQRAAGGDNVTESGGDPHSGYDTLDIPPPFGATGDIAVFMSARFADGYYFRRMWAGTLPESLGWSIPTLGRIGATGPLGGSASRPELPFFLDGGEPGDATVVQLSYPAEGETATWKLTLPGAASGTAVFPEIPPDLAVWAPSSAAGTRYLVQSARSVGVEPGGALSVFNAEHDHTETELVSALTSPL